MTIVSLQAEAGAINAEQAGQVCLIVTARPCFRLRFRPSSGLHNSMQAMERRYTALAEEQGQLAADKEKLSSEKQALMEVAVPTCCHRNPPCACMQTPVDLHL